MSILGQIFDAQKRFLLELMAKSGVVGVGVGFKDNQGELTDELALIALVEQKKPKEALTEADMIPPDLQGVRTDVKEVGIITAQSVNPRARMRPMQPGVSVGHYLVTAGTFGAVVYDKTTGVAYILSNNHVLANSNDALLNDVILQPGATDSGANPNDVVAKLVRYSQLMYVDDFSTGSNPIIGLPDSGSTGGDDDTPPRPPQVPPQSNGGCAQLLIGLANALDNANTTKTAAQAVPNRAFAQAIDTAATTSIEAQAAIPENILDAALAQPIDPSLLNPALLNIGMVTGTTEAALGMKVRKMGRTTGYTEGMVTVMNATVDVGYSTRLGKRTARFTGQVMTTGMSQGGDSGSLVVAQDLQDAVGLLFAGSGTTTVFTPIATVLDKLHVRMVGLG